MQKPSLGWQSWSPPFPAWHGFPRWDYSPFKLRPLKSSFRESPGKPVKIRYWCSWYAYGWNITDQKIRETLVVIKKHSLPFTHIIIDDGWTLWGDWHNPDNTRFPDLVATTKLIHANKLKAGLWFSPFLASSKSKLYHDHPDWFVKYHNKPVRGLKTIPIGEWLIPQSYLLDFEQTATRKYITEFIDLAITKWKFDFLKLDFLYAPYFNPHYDSDHIPHAQIIWLLKYIKTNYPKVTTIVCGSPFAPTLGLADIVRISKDTALPPVVPNFVNRLVYSVRVKMLQLKLSAVDLPVHISLDPDIRRFSLDTKSTGEIWDTIQTNILGIGDNLTKLSKKNIEAIKLWLTNHNSQ